MWGLSSSGALLIWWQCIFQRAIHVCALQKFDVDSDNLEYIAKDGFNFFQSQVRINIECAFGILVHRFGILRKPIPVNISVQKTTSLVLALCKLHNFCINQNDSNVSSAFESDVANIVREGGIYRPSMDKDGNATWSYDFQESSKDRLSSILDGGDHHGDLSREDHRKYRYRKHLPRDAILRKVRNGRHGCPPRSRSRRWTVKVYRNYDTFYACLLRSVICIESKVKTLLHTINSL